MSVEALIELALRSTDFTQFKQRLWDYRREKAMSNSYEQALRDCLLDCKSIIDGYRNGKRFDHMGSFDGQVKALLRDIENLRNREDCPNYDYKKENGQ